MPYWQLFYHFVWATKNRIPLLTPKVEPVVNRFIRNKAIDLDGVVFALNGTTDHVHLVVAVPPKISLSRFIGQVKGVASAKLNQSNLSDVYFAWQEEYGVFSFDGKRLPNYVAYVKRQKEHHANNTTIPVLERFTDKPVKFMRESTAVYQREEEAWRQEMTPSFSRC